MLTYCANDPKDESTFSIPSWIIGTWSNSNGDQVVFSTDNIIATLADGTTTDLKAQTVAGAFTVIDKMSNELTFTTTTIDGNPVPGGGITVYTKQ